MSTAPEAAKADPKAAKKATAAPKAAHVGKAHADKAGDKPVKAAKADKPAKAVKAAKLARAAAVKARARRLAKNDAGAPTRKPHDPARLAQILVAPIVSEKATMVAEKHNQVLFKVLRGATKPEIKAAVEQMWPGKIVVSVQTVQHKGKQKRFGKSIGRRDHVKKAYVSLAEGQELNFSGEGA